MFLLHVYILHPAMPCVIELLVEWRCVMYSVTSRLQQAVIGQTSYRIAQMLDDFPQMGVLNNQHGYCGGNRITAAR